MTIPRDDAFDATLSLMREGYPFLWHRFQRFGTDVFGLRLLGKRTVAIHGKEAASLFHDPSKLGRRDAATTILSPESIEALMTRTAREWRRAVRIWSTRSRVVLFDEAAKVLTAATCAWAGAPIPDDELEARTADFVATVDAFDGATMRPWHGELARARVDRWMTGVVEDARREKIDVDPDSALATFALAHREKGELVPAKRAASQILGVIRPIVASAWHIAFAAHAMNAMPETRETLLGERGGYTDAFIHEVKRFYPFTAFAGAKVREPFEWRGHRFERGARVVLDVYGMNHDAHVWHEPENFRPERFIGSHDGDPVVTQELAMALHVIVRCIVCHVPRTQDLTIDLSRIPARPRSGFVIEGVRPLTRLDDDFPSHESVPRIHEPRIHAVRASVAS